MSTHEGLPREFGPKDEPETHEESGENREELRSLIARLDKFVERPWFRTFVRTVMLPTLMTAEAWDKITKEK